MLKRYGLIMLANNCLNHKLNHPGLTKTKILSVFYIIKPTPIKQVETIKESTCT